MAEVISTRLTGDLKDAFEQYCEETEQKSGTAIRALIGIALGHSPEIIARREATMAAIAAVKAALNKHITKFASQVQRSIEATLEDG